LSGKGLVETERRRFNAIALAPSLIVLFMIAGLPAIYLVVTSLTPFQLVNPGSSTDFSSPLRNYRLLLDDPRFVNSLWVQAKLSFWGVLFQVRARSAEPCSLDWSRAAMSHVAESYCRGPRATAPS